MFWIERVEVVDFLVMEEFAQVVLALSVLTAFAVLVAVFVNRHCMCGECMLRPF